MKDLDTLLFKVRSTLGKPRCGSLLMAAPFVNDVKFRHSVVSIIDYVATEGATGVVLNNPTGYTLAELLDDESVGGDVPVYRGGPIGQDRLFFLHNLGTAIIPGAREYSPGMFVGGDFDAVISYLRSGYASDGYIKFFIGYCSWADGQLENEIGQAHWAILDTLPPSGVVVRHRRQHVACHGAPSRRRLPQLAAGAGESQGQLTGWMSFPGCMRRIYDAGNYDGATFKISQVMIRAMHRMRKNC
jgi:putative transcriptional regulator